MGKNIPSILLIGVGWWGGNHLRILLKLQATGLCRLVGVQANNQDVLQYINKEFGVQTFCDDRGLEEADAVVIATPTHNHFAIAEKALMAGKDVLIEKPLTPTLKEAYKLKEINASSSQILMVGHTFRYNPAVDYVKKLLLDEEIGNIRFL